MSTMLKSSWFHGRVRPAPASRPLLPLRPLAPTPRPRPLPRAPSSTAERREEILDLDSKAIRESAKQRMTELMTQLASGQAAGGAGAAAGGAEAAALRGRLNQAIVEMQRGLIERDTEVRLLLLAALSGEHVLYLGPPGTAKSELGRRLSRVVKGNYFERLLTRFSVPEELFGPLSMRALEEDVYLRQTKGYLPDSKVAFIDEIFKANSAILNTLLTILNERLFDNGSLRSKVPLVCLVGASNELPESEELDALYDRFLFRKQVRQVSPSGLAALLSSLPSSDDEWNPTPTPAASLSVSDTRVATLSDAATPGAASTSDGAGAAGAKAAAKGAKGGASKKDSGAGAGENSGEVSKPAVAFTPLIRDDDFANARREALARVTVAPEVVNLLADLRQYLQEACEPPVYVSDRRLVKAVNMLRVAAWTNGRTQVSIYDCVLLQHCLWQRPEEQDRINDYLLQSLASDDGLKQCQYLLSSLYGRSCRVGTDPARCDELLVEVRRVKQVLVDKMSGLAATVAGAFPVVLDNLWLGVDEAQALASALGPKLEKTKGSVESLLFEVIALEAALEARTEPVVLAELLPKYWSEFIRSGAIEDVAPLGLSGPGRP